MPDPANDPSNALSMALAYAAVGLRVLPIKPGTKRPPMREWVDAATTDVGMIGNWFTGMYADHGVGLAMGHQPDGRFVFALDVDEHDPAHSGVETLTDLTTANGVLPDTWCSITGSGGLHLLFESPVEVRNGVAGDGLDVRGEGGQIVVAPSMHPVTNRRYEWEDTFAPWERPLAPAPDWLIELVRLPLTPVTPAPTPSPGSTFADPDSPAEWLRSWWHWVGELRTAGWTEHHTAHNGDIHWTRPGKQRREGESAVLHMPDGPFVVFSTDASVLGLHRVGRVNVDGSVSVSPFEFYAAQEHGGDLSAAARFLLTKMPGADRRLSVAGPTVTGEHPFAGYMAQKIDWVEFDSKDHQGENWVARPLIPAGRLVALYAPAKQGKSEVALAVVAALATGRPILGQPNPNGPRHVIYLDYEMTQDDLSARLEVLGYDETTDRSHLHYWSLPNLPPLDTAEGAAVLRWMAKECTAEAVVIDTMGRAVEGDENSNDTYRAFARHTGLALKFDGVAILRTDHAGKDKEKGQRGASAKNDDADVVYRVDRIDDGWRLTRTHTRINWVPEMVIIDRQEVTDKPLRIELAPTSVPRFMTGTGHYVKELEAAGIVYVPGMTRTKLQKLAQALDPPLSKGTDALRDALRWMQYYGGATPVAPGGLPALTPHPDDDRPGEGHTEDGLPPNLGDVR